MENENKIKEPINQKDEKVNEKEKKLIRFNESILVFAIPILGYFYSCAYELGFCNYFKIPEDLISISISNLLISVLNIAIFSMFFLIMSKVFFVNVMKQSNILKMLLITFLSAMLFFGIFYLTIIFPEKLILIFTVITLSAIIFIFPFVFIKSKRISEEFPFISSSKKESLRNLALLIYILIFLSLVLFTMGKTKAEAQKYFYVLEENQEKVVLRIYNENLICAPFDRKTKKVFLDFSIKKISESSISLRLEKVGPLKPISSTSLKLEKVGPLKLIEKDKNGK